MFNLKKYAQEQSLSGVARSIYDTGDLKGLDTQLSDAAHKITDETKGNINTTQEAKKSLQDEELQEFVPVFEGVELLLQLKNDHTTGFTDEEKNNLIGRLRGAHKVSPQSLNLFQDIQTHKISEQEAAIDSAARATAIHRWESEIKPELMTAVSKMRRNVSRRPRLPVASSVTTQKIAQNQNPSPGKILPVEHIGDFIKKFVDIVLAGDGQNDQMFNAAQSEVVPNVSEALEQEAQSAFDTLRNYLGNAEEEQEIAAILIKIYSMLPTQQTQAGENNMGENNMENQNQPQPMQPQAPAPQMPAFNLAKHKEQMQKTASMEKDAYTNLGDAYLLYGPTEKRICPKLGGRGGGKTGASDVVSEEICRFHCLDGIVLDDNKTICGEAVFRAHVMDKFSRDYVDADGNLVGGYLNKRFEINRNVPEENKMRLKPGETRKPMPPSWRSTESRLQAMRNKEGEKRGYSPTNTGAPFDWQKDVDQNNVQVSQEERDRREKAMGHETVQYTKRDQSENDPRMPKNAQNEKTTKTAQVVPSEGFADGGEPYTEDEMHLMNRPEIKDFSDLLFAVDQAKTSADLNSVFEAADKIIVSDRQWEVFHRHFDPKQEEIQSTQTEAFPREEDQFLTSSNDQTVKEAKKKDKKWMQSIKNKGSFTEYCGGKVTNKCISKGKKSPDTKTKRRAELAETFREQAKKKKKAFNLKEYKTAQLGDQFDGTLDYNESAQMQNRADEGERKAKSIIDEARVMLEQGMPEEDVKASLMGKYPNYSAEAIDGFIGRALQIGSDISPHTGFGNESPSSESGIGEGGDFPRRGLSSFLGSDQEIKEAGKKEKGTTYKGTHYKVNPWRICNESTGGKKKDPEKFESCVKQVKEKSKTKKSFNLKNYKTAQMTGPRGPYGEDNPSSDDLGLSPDYVPDEDDYNKQETEISPGAEEIIYAGINNAKTKEEILEIILNAHKNWQQEGLNSPDLDDIMTAAYERAQELGTSIEESEQPRFQNLGIEGPPIPRRHGPRYFAKSKSGTKTAQDKKKSELTNELTKSSSWDFGLTGYDNLFQALKSKIFKDKVFRSRLEQSLGFSDIQDNDTLLDAALERAEEINVADNQDAEFVKVWLTPDGSLSIDVRNEMNDNPESGFSSFAERDDDSKIQECKFCRNKLFKKDPEGKWHCTNCQTPDDPHDANEQASQFVRSLPYSQKSDDFLDRTAQTKAAQVTAQTKAAQVKPRAAGASVPTSIIQKKRLSRKFQDKVEKQRDIEESAKALALED